MKLPRRRTVAQVAVLILAASAFIAGRLAEVSIRDPRAVLVVSVLAAAFLTAMLLVS